MNLNKISHTTISVLLILVLLVTSLPLTSMNTSAEAVSQTKYNNITDFQNARWTEIQNKVFGQNYTSVQPADAIKDLPVQQGNEFFNWTDTSHMQGYDNNGNEIDGGLQKYGTTTVTSMTSTSVTEKYADSYVNYKDVKTSVKSQATYTVYNVYTADQFAWVLNQVNNVNSIKLNLLADIDMGGFDNKQFATGRSLTSTMYIEGNGHTVYNLKMYGTNPHFGIYNEIYGESKLIVNNLGFQSVMLLHFNVTDAEPAAGLLFGYAYPRPARNTNVLSLENVHVRNTFYQQSVNNNFNNQGIAFLGGKGFYKKLFVKNCSTSDGYIYGGGHVGGMFSLTDDNPNNNAQVKYDFEYPKNQMAFAFYDSANVFPLTFYNSYSVNCEMFSTGMDSGAFVSCARGITAINCFTNNTMYSNKNTGGFIGRIIRDGLGGVTLYDLNGNEENIGCVFRNCYSDGTVEGNVAMGGFTGYDSNYRTYQSPEKKGNESGSNNSFNYHATTVYQNCYSTTMVGMDYTGKYCGGFVGLDDNYAKATKGVKVKATDGTIIDNIYGNIYMNCYAAGEVGNILTQTDTEKSVEYDNTFYTQKYYNSTSDMDNYYPSGGFIGAIVPDSYYLSSGRNSRSGNTFGYFYNCYYDMQTTGMHEMAIGLAYAETCRDDASGQNARKGVNANSKVVHKDANGNETPFSVIGITGVYTEKSDTKNVAGLTGLPVEYKDSSGNVLSRMSMGSETAVDSENTDVWQYNQGYYPQLKTFMAADTTVQNMADVSESNITDQVKSSQFYVGNSPAETDSNGYITKPATATVLSRANSTEKIYENYQPNTNVYAAQLAGVVTAYRYSQASTATVKLNHWDYKMNTADGSLSTDNDWKCGVEANRLTYNEATDFFENTYTGLAAGKYSFKVQANNSMAYNYGSDRFDGQDCVLNIPVENCTAKIMFKYNGLRSQNYQIYAVLTNSNGKPIDENGAETVD
ncbi:pullulanase X25 domain-containing protein, partial [Oscillospiraceae bacterium LCP25S3_E10]